MRSIEIGPVPSRHTANPASSNAATTMPARVSRKIFVDPRIMTPRVAEDAMSSYPLLSAISALPGALPRPGEPDRVPVALERWHEAAARGGPEAAAFGHALADDPAGAALLAAIFGNSPFLTEGLLADVIGVRDLLAHGADRTFAEILDGINDDLAAQPTATVMRVLRAAKRRAAVAIAGADIAGLGPLAPVT